MLANRGETTKTEIKKVYLNLEKIINNQADDTSKNIFFALMEANHLKEKAERAIHFSCSRHVFWLQEKPTEPILENPYFFSYLLLSNPLSLFLINASGNLEAIQIIEASTFNKLLTDICNKTEIKPNTRTPLDVLLANEYYDRLLNNIPGSIQTLTHREYALTFNNENYLVSLSHNIFCYPNFAHIYDPITHLRGKSRLHLTLATFTIPSTPETKFNNQQIRVLKFEDLAYNTFSHHDIEEKYQAVLKKVSDLDFRPPQILDYPENRSIMIIYDMVYLPYPSLSDLIMREVLSERQMIGIAHKIVTALYEFHDKSLIHGDIKPGNILINESKAYLIDVEESRLSKMPVIRSVGTTGYYSPSEFLTKKSDIYALGVTLYNLFTGQTHEQIQQTHLKNYIQNNLVIKIINEMLNTKPDARPNARQVKNKFDTIINAEKKLTSLSNICINSNTHAVEPNRFFSENRQKKRAESLPIVVQSNREKLQSPFSKSAEALPSSTPTVTTPMPTPNPSPNTLSPRETHNLYRSCRVYGKDDYGELNVFLPKEDGINDPSYP